MKVDITPESKYEARGNKERLSVRITMHVDADTRAETKELRKKLDKLQEDESVGAVLDLIKEMNG